MEICRPRVFGGVGGRLFGKVGRKAFVEGDDGDVRHVVQSVDEALGLAHLLSAFAAQCKWKPDDDAIDLVLADQGRQTREPVTGRSLFDLGGLLTDLEDLLGRPVDVVTEKGLRDRIRKRVLQEAIPL